MSLVSLGSYNVPRETENNAYAKFLGDKQRALRYVMAFVECSIAGMSVSHDRGALIIRFG